MTEIQKRLFELQDIKYGDFTSKLIPGVNRESVIGVRTPELRSLAKEFFRDPSHTDYMKVLPHEYYEENMLHGFLIELTKDYGECIRELDAFLPFVDNWSVCDCLSPKVFRKNREILIDDIKRWISSGKTFTVRYGIVNLMKHFLDECFEPEYNELVARISSGEYYIMTAQAWYFATALAKQWKDTMVYIESGRLDSSVHNMAIRKATESYRITAEQKELLKKLRVKEK